MQITVETKFTIGDAVIIPTAHTTKTLAITDILVQVGKHGPAFAEITYLTDDPEYQSVMENAIIGKGFAPMTEVELQGYTECASNPDNSPFFPDSDEQYELYKTNEQEENQ